MVYLPFYVQVNVSMMGNFRTAKCAMHYLQDIVSFAIIISVQNAAMLWYIMWAIKLILCENKASLSR